MRAAERREHLERLGVARATQRYALLIEATYPASCFASRAELAELWGCDDSQVRRMHRELVAAGAWEAVAGRGFRYLGEHAPPPRDSLGTGSLTPGRGRGKLVDNSTTGSLAPAPTGSLTPGLPVANREPDSRSSRARASDSLSRATTSSSRRACAREATASCAGRGAAAAAEPGGEPGAEPWLAALRDRLRLNGPRLHEVAAGVRRAAAEHGLVEGALVEDLLRWAATKRNPAGAVVALAREQALLDAQERACRASGPHDAPEVVGNLALVRRALDARREDPGEERAETRALVEALCAEVESWAWGARVAGLTTTEADHLRRQVQARRARQALASRPFARLGGSA